MKKVRVFELAKEFGMKGPDFSKLLKDSGFDNVKTHMTVLDDADLMMIEARLSTLGVRRQPDGTEPAASPVPKKKLLPKGEQDTETEAEAAATPTAPGTLHKRELKELPKKPLPKGPAPKKPLRKPDEESGSEPAHETPAIAAVPTETRPPVPEPVPEAPPRQEPEPLAVEARHVPPVAPAPTVAPAVPEPAVPERAVARATPAPAVTASTDEPPTTTSQPAVAEIEPPTAPAQPADEPAPVPAAEHRPEAPAERPATPSRPTTATPAAPAPVPSDVKRLLVPQKKATVVGRIELPQETIRDATRRSAPAAERDLRRAALQNSRQRTAQRTASPPGQRRGPGGPGGRPQPGSRDFGPGRPGQRRSKIATTVDPTKVIEIEAPVSIKALSEALGTKVSELIATLTFKLKIAGKNINSFLTNDEVEYVAIELDRNLKIVEHKEAEDELIEQLVEDSAGELEILRAPVVTFMGHVDHGKTSLMDALRNSDVAKGEAGGITQHIGAYKVTTEHGQQFVILDTPGHAAFTAMRARGAQLTDIVVLVVAGDDGVKPQTEEAINHAKAAGVKVVVAITKCDLPSANAMQVKQQLMIKGLQAEDFGGETGVVEVSSVTRKGLDELVERLMLETEIMQLKARPDAPGKGVVVESKQSPEQGVVVTVLVTDGTLRLKDQIVCGESFARVRAMIDDHGENLAEAGPSTPITVFGLDRLPSPGDKLFVVDDAKKAREVVEERQRRIRELSLAERSAITLETLSAELAKKKSEEIKIILKADAMGSLEPLRKCLEDLTTPEVRVNLVHSALGGINETDVSLAQASGAVIVGFNTVADTSARQAAERAGVEIRYYDIIYELLDNVRAAMEGLLKPQEVESIIGHAEVKATFKSSKFGVIAGCIVKDGLIKRAAKVRLTRDSKVVWSGKLGSLRRVADDVRDVKAGFECGLTLDGFQDIKIADVLEFSTVELVKRTL
ncbi:MAG: translation initiation factor IF-2 [Planctomycetes bacterium]|nr:translation initiation factor IF-2 [Planctomycetota bacterium]